MLKQIALATLFTICTARLSATPADWCIRPEASQYKALDLLPGSRAKEVVYPRGAGGLSDHRETFTLAPDGLLRTVRREFAGQNCLETFDRHTNGVLLSRITTCSPKPSSGPPTTYLSKAEGWAETNEQGTEITTLERIMAFGAVWRVRTQNLDRKWPMPPGSFEQRHFDSKCREVGPTSFLEMRANARGPVAGNTITVNHTITSTQRGYERTTRKAGSIIEIDEFDSAGMLVNEQYFEPDQPRNPFAIRVTDFALDERGNWKSKRTVHRNFHDGGKPSEEFVERTVSYYP